MTLTPVGVFQHGDPLPLVVGTYGAVTGLPELHPGVLLIVSALVRTALPDRKDLASPVDVIRDEKGVILGCRALEINL